MKKIKLLILMIIVMFGVTLISVNNAELSTYALEDNPDRPIYERNLEFSPIKAPDYVGLVDNKNKPSETPILLPKDFPATSDGKKAEGGIWYNIYTHIDAKLFYIIYDPGITNTKVKYDVINAPTVRYLGKERKQILVNLKANGNYRLESHIDYGLEELVVVRNDDFDLRLIDYDAPAITYKRATFIDGSIKLKFTITDRYYSGGDKTAGSGIKKIIFFELISETEDRIIKEVEPDIAPSVQITREMSFDVLITERGVYAVTLEDNIGNIREVLVWEIDENLGEATNLLNAAQDYINREVEFNPKLISELKQSADECRYAYNNKYSTEDEKATALKALQLSLNKMNNAKKQVIVTINNQDLLKNGKLYHNITVERHFPEAKYGDEIKVNINISIYNKKSTFNSEITKLVKFEVDEIIKLDFNITLNGEEYKVKVPINIQMPLYNEDREYNLINFVGGKYSDLDYKQGNGFITFDITEAKGTIFVPINKGLSTIFYIILSVVILVLIITIILLIIKKRRTKATENISSVTQTQEVEEQSEIKVIPKNKSKKKKGGKK